MKRLGFQLVLGLTFCVGCSSAFQLVAPESACRETTSLCGSKVFHNNHNVDAGPSSRRNILQNLSLSLLSLGIPLSARSEDFAARDKERKYVQESYDDFTRTKDGWSYRDVKPGNGEGGKEGDRVVFSWSGYTIGYFGRPFEAKGGPQGGAFDKDLDYERTVIGSEKMVRGLEQALKGMPPGAVRQVIVPYENGLSYPQEEDPTHERVGPKPSTFSGQRALNFVLDNPRLDRTLLFNVKVIRVDKADGKGGFTRG